MKANQYYTVEQTRSVSVVANNAADAAAIATYAFEHGQNADHKVRIDMQTDHPLFGIHGNTTTPIKELSLHVDREF